MQDEIDPFEARQAVLEPLLAAQQLLGVLEGAEASGIITRLVSGPASTLELADIAGVDVAVVSAVVAAASWRLFLAAMYFLNFGEGSSEQIEAKIQAYNWLGTSTPDDAIRWMVLSTLVWPTVSVTVRVRS